jgi:Cadherin domain
MASKMWETHSHFRSHLVPRFSAPFLLFVCFPLANNLLPFFRPPCSMLINSGMNSEITYSIQTDNNKNSSEFFHIDEAEGTVYLKKSLDHETLQHHHFTIRVADKGSPALSSSKYHGFDEQSFSTCCRILCQLASPRDLTSRIPAHLARHSL